jgi:hypothetical protein
MQPYQEAAEHNRRYGESGINALKYAGIGALGTLGSRAASTLIAKIAPLLNPKVPETFAKKALEKVDPRLGKFVKTAEGMGATFDETRDFIQNKIDTSQAAKENRNIIEQESPELHSFLDQEIRKGRKPVEAGALAQNDKRFASIVKKLMKAHKTPWSSIVESIFGNGQMAQPSQQQGQQEQPQAQQGQQQGQGLDPQVAQILQQGNEIMKRFMGQQ